jgi:hypothetical protein
MAEKLGGRRSDNRRPPHSRLEGLNPGRAFNTSNTRGLSSQTHTQSAHLMADETKRIELRPCGLQHQADWILRFEGCSEHVDGSSRARAGIGTRRWKLSCRVGGNLPLSRAYPSRSQPDGPRRPRASIYRDVAAQDGIGAVLRGRGYFKHTDPMFKGRFMQLPIYAEEQRVETLVRLRRLDSELTGREFIAADRYTIADITDQVPLDLFTALAHQPFPSELPNVTRRYNAVSARPSARA